MFLMLISIRHTHQVIWSDFNLILICFLFKIQGLQKLGESGNFPCQTVFFLLSSLLVEDGNCCFLFILLKKKKKMIVNAFFYQTACYFKLFVWGYFINNTSRKILTINRGKGCSNIEGIELGNSPFLIEECVFRLGVAP